MSALGWLRAWWSRIIAGLAFATVATVTGRISYIHIEALTLSLGQPMTVARIMPFGIDGLIVVGSVALLQATGSQPWLGWLCVGPGAAASLFANVESEVRRGPVAAGWAGMASVGFFLATFVFERWMKSQAAGVAGMAAANTVSNDADGSMPEPDPCPHQLPSSVDEAVITTFLHSRDCTGEPLSARQLSVAFGLNRLRVAELVKAALGDAAGAPAPEPEPSLNGAGAGA